jgi:hypothetical protein
MNRNKIIVINQPYFLGDILFSMAQVQKYVNDGYNVIYPVRDEYMNLQKNFPMVKLVPLSQFYEYETLNTPQPIIETDRYVILSLRHSYTRKGLPYHMRDKYEAFGLPLDLWRELLIIRDYEAEKKLFAEIGVNPDEKYNLINEFERPFFNRIPIVVESEYRNIYMSKIGNFSLLDWIGVIEKAQSIHAIGSAILYVMETISTMPNEIHIYRRWDENTNKFHDHMNYSFLFNKNFIYH